ncbi:MAG TPA: ATP-binding protein [Chitinophagaceae bacterium]|nr:ATP-binding protein [Chitinophagaceae bacterium]
MNRYFRYIVFAIFLVSILTIVVIQYNADTSINELIRSNESLLGELSIKKELQQLQTGIADLESKVRGVVISGNTDTAAIEKEIRVLKVTLINLRVLDNEEMIRPILSDLNRLVENKIDFNREVLQVNNSKGKRSAEDLINTKKGTALTDSIKLYTKQIDEIHQITVTKLIRDADKNGIKARTFGSIMAILASVAAMFIFGYIAYKVRQQQQMIAKLDASEKMSKEAARLKENFLANMSHEIRTPMNAILGFTNLLQYQQLDPKSMEYVQTIRKSGQNLLNIINDILDLSKIEAGMMRIESSPFSLRSVASTVERMFSKKATDKGITLSYTIDENVPDILEGDATRLTQILVNLVGNSVKFTEKGSVELRFYPKKLEGENIRLGIEVRDTGIGIEKEKLTSVFERFSQADDDVTRKYGGTGLGLAIVRDLVSLQDGTIEVTSDPGKGTRFYLAIPYKIHIDQEVHIPVASVEKQNFENFAGARILAVEDNAINQSLIRHLLKEWEIEVDISGNGLDALEKLKANKYQLVLMDIQMPGMDGYTATRKIREELKLDLPIVAMTAHALAGEREKCLERGMNAYISKPIRQDLLYEIIAGFLHVENKTEGQFEFINLDYMKQVSNGNTEYEKTVTRQFLEAVPVDLEEIHAAWAAKDIQSVRRLAHNMKTTVSVMGLNSLLQPWLDKLEYEDLSEADFNGTYLALQSACISSIEEAKLFLSSLEVIS